MALSSCSMVFDCEAGTMRYVSSAYLNTVAYLEFYKEEGEFSLTTSAYTQWDGLTLFFYIFLWGKTFFAKGGGGPMPPEYAT